MPLPSALSAVRAVAGSSIAFCPPLIISEAQIDEIIEKFGKALADTQDFVTRERLVA
jgi:adenosylmethionine-8-amino-7-oxononanoate aminotransferase